MKCFVRAFSEAALVLLSSICRTRSSCSISNLQIMPVYNTNLVCAENSVSTVSAKVDASRTVSDTDWCHYHALAEVHTLTQHCHNRKPAHALGQTIVKFPEIITRRVFRLMIFSLVWPTTRWLKLFEFSQLILMFKPIIPFCTTLCRDAPYLFPCSSFRSFNQLCSCLEAFLAWKVV